MPKIVIDASFALSLLFPDEIEEQATARMDALLVEGAIAPSLWPLEIANALLTAERRKRITRQFRRDSLADLRALPIEVDVETHLQAWQRTTDLAEEHGLTLYDACYLELAARRGAPLATLDVDLRNAAVAAGIPLFDAA